MVPVAELKVNAAPGDGEMSHDVMAPPLVVGPMLGLMATFLVAVISVVPYVTPGGASLMVMLTWAEVEPPELLAQTVYVVAVVCSTVGVPLIFPSEVPQVKPLGKDGSISQDVTVPPLTVGRFGVIAVPFSRVMFSGVYSREFGGTSFTVK